MCRFRSSLFLLLFSWAEKRYFSERRCIVQSSIHLGYSTERYSKYVSKPLVFLLTLWIIELFKRHEWQYTWTSQAHILVKLCSSRNALPPSQNIDISASLLHKHNLDCWFFFIRVFSMARIFGSNHSARVSYSSPTTNKTHTQKRFIRSRQTNVFAHFPLTNIFFLLTIKNAHMVCFIISTRWLLC